MPRPPSSTSEMHLTELLPRGVGDPLSLIPSDWTFVTTLSSWMAKISVAISRSTPVGARVDRFARSQTGGDESGFDLNGRLDVAGHAGAEQQCGQPEHTRLHRGARDGADTNP
jgi:hypothetical protein